MSMIDKIKDNALDMMSFLGVGPIWKGVKKFSSGARWLLTKSPMLIRRGAQIAAIYASTYGAEKALDFLHEKFPDNKLITKADAIADKIVNTENAVAIGAVSLAELAYNKTNAKDKRRAADLSKSENTVQNSITKSEDHKEEDRKNLSVEELLPAGKTEAEFVDDILLSMCDMHSHYDIVPGNDGFTWVRSFEIDDNMLEEYGLPSDGEQRLGWAKTLDEMHKKIILNEGPHYLKEMAQKPQLRRVAPIKPQL